MNKRLAWSAVVLLASLVTLPGCQSEGPAERAGAGVDNAARDLKNAVDPAGPVEKAGRAVDNAVNK